MKKKHFLSEKYTVEDNKVIILSVIIGLIVMVLLAIARYLLDFKTFAYIDFILASVFISLIIVIFIISKSKLYHSSKYFFFVFMMYNIVMTIVYMLGFVDDFSSIVIGLSYIATIVSVIIGMTILERKFDCSDALRGRK